MLIILKVFINWSNLIVYKNDKKIFILVIEGLYLEIS